jgi:hypothetical protein
VSTTPPFVRSVEAQEHRLRTRAAAKRTEADRLLREASVLDEAADEIEKLLRDADPRVQCKSCKAWCVPERYVCRPCQSAEGDEANE